MTTRKLRRAVLVSLEREEGGLRIRLDDVECDASSSKLWVQKEHVTSKVVEEDSFREMALGEDEFASFGAYIFARLNAYLELKEN